MTHDGKRPARDKRAPNRRATEIPAPQKRTGEKRTGEKRTGEKRSPIKRAPAKQASGKTVPGRPAPAKTLEVERAPERIAKVIARAGICSRREAEKLITEGRVTLNGRVLDTPALTVGPDDIVTVDGAPLPAREHVRLWLYHKPRGLITTTNDPEGRPTIFEKLPDDMPRVVTVGRLDLNSEGLLLLTNDGALARRLELPETAWRRRYRVRVHGSVHAGELDTLKNGIEIENVAYGPIDAVVEREVGHNSWLSVTLREGKNREIRRVMEHLGYPVARLIRVAFGPFQLGQLPPGEVREVKGKVLRDQLGSLGRGLDLPPRGAPTGEQRTTGQEAKTPRQTAPTGPARKGRPEKTPTPKKAHPEKGRPEKGRPEKARPEAGKRSAAPSAKPAKAAQRPTRVLRGRMDRPQTARTTKTARK